MKTAYENTLRRFCETYSVPPEAIAALKEGLHTLQRTAAFSGFSAAVGRYEADRPDFDFAAELAGIDALSPAAGVHTYTLQLLWCVCLIPHAREKFARENIPEEIFRASMADLKWKLLECHKVYGIWGSFVAAWFARWFDATRVALGRLQFEMVRLGDIDGLADFHAEKNGVSLCPDSTLVNVHIPSSGHMPHVMVLEAYRRAAKFFAPRLGGQPVVFACESWLLWPEHEKFLPKTSNILSFAADYDIVYSKATEGEDLWRIFYTEYHGDPSALPVTSSTTRAYAGWLQNGGQTGFGVGLFIWSQEPVALSTKG